MIPMLSPPITLTALSRPRIQPLRRLTPVVALNPQPIPKCTRVHSDAHQISNSTHALRGYARSRAPLFIIFLRLFALFRGYSILRFNHSNNQTPDLVRSQLLSTLNSELSTCARLIRSHPTPKFISFFARAIVHTDRAPPHARLGTERRIPAAAAGPE